MTRAALINGRSLGRLQPSAPGNGSLPKGPRRDAWKRYPGKEGGRLQAPSPAAGCPKRSRQPTEQPQTCQNGGKWDFPGLKRGFDFCSPPACPAIAPSATADLSRRSFSVGGPVPAVKQSATADSLAPLIINDWRHSAGEIFASPNELRGEFLEILESAY